MEARNLDLDVALTREQWQQLGRTAGRMGVDEAGLDWDEDSPEAIRLHMRPDDAPAGWRAWMARDDTYGTDAPEVARFQFNGGDPFAELDPPVEPSPPNVTEPQEAALERRLEDWVRARWHGLLEASGLHFERGHLPQG